MNLFQVEDADPHSLSSSINLSTYLIIRLLQGNWITSSQSTYHTTLFHGALGQVKIQFRATVNLVRPVCGLEGSPKYHFRELAPRGPSI